jgi:calpain-7
METIKGKGKSKYDIVQRGLKKNFFFFCVFTYLAGVYTVVASTFEANLIGQFVLTAASDIPLAIEPISTEGAVRGGKGTNGHGMDTYHLQFNLIGHVSKNSQW